MTTTRRQFICGAVCLVALPGVGCAMAPSIRGEVVDDEIRVDLADWPTEANVVVVRRDDRKSPVIAVRHPSERFTAVSSICTHQGCTVRPESERLVCPCHGSVFNLEGEVLRGPADDRLARLPARVDGSTLAISQPKLPL